MEENRYSKQTAAELIEQVTRFNGDPSELLHNILAIQCFLGQADGGAILTVNQEQNVDVLAIYPQVVRGGAAPQWLAKAVGFVPESVSADDVLVKEIDGGGHVLLFPLKLSFIPGAVSAFVVEGGRERDIESCRQELLLLISLLDLAESQPARQYQSQAIRQMHRAMEALSVVNGQDKFTGAAMAFCNEVASQWRCERVSLGFLKGRYIEIKAMSHTEDFSRKMKIIQDIESAMEECFDQDIEIVLPLPEETVCVVRAAENLSKQHGPMSILSLPLRYRDENIGVLTLERPSDEEFTLAQVEAVRLVCELATARLSNLYDNDRWFGARIAAKSEKFLSKVLGPTHTGAKVAAIIVFAAILFLVFAKGMFKVKTPFMLEATVQQVIPAPFDGYLDSVEVEIDSAVTPADTLGRLDTSELKLRLAAAKAEKLGYIKQANAAMRDGQTAQAQIAQANSDKAEAEILLLEYMIGRARLTSPISGTVVKGDLKRQIGAPVKTGDILFEVAPLDTLRAVLLVPENEVFEIEVGQEGALATASYPSQRIKFVVERINPMAEVVEQRNVFKVRVKLIEIHSWMRPGMEGVAKVSIEKRHYAWIWTRKIVNWIRMKLWL